MRWQIGIFLAASLLSIAAMPADNSGDPKLRAAVMQKYPGTKIVAWCSGNSIARPGEAVAALRDQSHTSFRVIMAGKNGSMREVESVPMSKVVGEFELQCISPREAKERIKTLRESEGIRNFLKVPAGKGAFCYFTDATETHCWSFDRKGDLIDAGGWQT